MLVLETFQSNDDFSIPLVKHPLQTSMHLQRISTLKILCGQKLATRTLYYCQYFSFALTNLRNLFSRFNTWFLYPEFLKLTVMGAATLDVALPSFQVTNQKNYYMNLV